ncbi:MAG TPA: cell envelope integrity protein CreD, partial [Hellea balneolensis]|nr:cell envelope integrity protein CreD [Hellea balneolensis]
FSASWSIPFLARGIAAQGDAKALNVQKLSRRAMSVKLVNPDNPYQNVNRALKYAVLFIGLVFLAYFLFETLVAVKVHAAQYVLVGLAQCVFYLLLLAFGEQFGFTPAFLLAAGATIALTALYAGVVFGRQYRLRAGVVFLATYGLLYVLMRMEDFALMVGALTAFVAIAFTMYLTRNISWYGDHRTMPSTK